MKSCFAATPSELWNKSAATGQSYQTHRHPLPRRRWCNIMCSSQAGIETDALRHCSKQKSLEKPTCSTRVLQLICTDAPHPSPPLPRSNSPFFSMPVHVFFGTPCTLTSRLVLAVAAIGDPLVLGQDPCIGAECFYCSWQQN